MYRSIVIEAVFAASTTTAKYSVYERNPNGTKGRTLESDMDWFELGGLGAVNVEVKDDIDSNVASIKFQDTMFPGEDGETWSDALDADGSLLAVTVSAATKGGSVSVKPDIIAKGALRIVALNGSDVAVAPGGAAEYTIRILAKG